MPTVTLRSMMVSQSRVKSSETSSSWKLKSSEMCSDPPKLLTSSLSGPSGLSKLNSRCVCARAIVRPSRVFESAVFSDADMNGGGFGAAGNAAQQTAGKIGQQGVSQNVIDVARAAFDFGAARSHFVEQGGVPGEFDLVILLEAPLDLGEFENDDLFEGLVADGVIGNDDEAAQEGGFEDFVELGLEGFDQAVGSGGGFGIGGQLHDGIGTGVAGEDDDGVLEIDFAALAIFHDALVEDLVEQLEDVGVSLFDFVEEHYGIRTAADGFGENAALAIADVAGRRALQSGNGMGFLELRHVDADEVFFAAIEQVGESESGFGLADTGGAGEEEDADGAAGVVERSAGGADTFGDAGEGVSLADDAAAEVVLEFEDCRDLVFEHLAERDSGPGGDDFADGLRVHADAHQGLLALQFIEGSVESSDLGAGGGGIGLIGQLSGRQLAFQPGAQFPDLRDQFALLFEMLTQGG